MVKIARVLEERFHEIVQRQPEVLAHHFEEAGLLHRSLEYRIRSAQRAIRRDWPCRGDHRRPITRPKDRLPELQIGATRNRLRELILLLGKP